VLITEVMFNPTGVEPDTEWVEVFNTTSEDRTLSGLNLIDGAGRTHVIGAGVTLAAGAYQLLVRDRTAAIAAGVPAGVILYEYGAVGDVQLANGVTGGVSLENGATSIAEAPYGGWFSNNGASIQLKTLSYAASSMQASWCQSAVVWTGSTDFGTPGAAADCP
jgi:hypothetical protein